MNSCNRTQIGTSILLLACLCAPITAFNFPARYNLLPSRVSTQRTYQYHKSEMRAPLSREWAIRSSVDDAVLVEGGEATSSTGKGDRDSNLAAGEPSASSPLWRVAVLGICILWSTNFAVIKEIFHAAPTIDPSLYAAIRFSLATLVLLPRTFNSLKNTDLILSSMGIGLFVFFGYLGQAIGLLTTSANKSAFICSLNVVWVALVSSVIRKEFKWSTWLSALMAVAGVAFLEFNGSADPPVIGDLWSLCQPIGFGTGYVLLEYLMAKYPSNAGAVSAFKLVSISGASIVWASANGHTLADLAPILEAPTAVFGLLYTGVITTAAAILLQSYAFKNVPATDVSLILASEPVWATIFAAGLLGEVVTVNDAIGGLLIIVACLANELNWFDKLIPPRHKPVE